MDGVARLAENLGLVVGGILVTVIVVGLVVVGARLLLFSVRDEEEPEGEVLADATTLEGRRRLMQEAVMLAVHMARADGAIAEREMDVIKAWCAQRVADLGEEFGSLQVRNALRSSLAPPVLAHSLAVIQRESDEAHRDLVLDLLLAVARADGQLHEQELAYYTTVAESLGLRRADALARAAQEEEPA